jgi:hypothetical protein
MIRLAAIVLLAAALVGCGSTSGATQFHAKAEAICAAARAELVPIRARAKVLAQGSPTRATVHELQDLIRRNAMIADRTFARLEALAKKEGLTQADARKACAGSTK